MEGFSKMTPTEIKLAYALVPSYEPLWVKVWREMGILRLDSVGRSFMCGYPSYRDIDDRLGCVAHEESLS
jgi:hypothetical protein